MQRWDDSIDSLYLFGNRKVFSCPVSVERHEGYFAVTPDTQWSDCYIPNQRVIKYYGFTGDTSCFKANQISHPSGNTLAMDRKVGITRDVGASFPDWPFLDDKVAANGRVGYYHSLGRGVNAVWADGHATWQEGGSLLTSHFTLDGN
jgi:prepilin-type processing-associated H-X9-DG protein